jgi:hypothetical protein
MPSDFSMKATRALPMLVRSRKDKRYSSDSHGISHRSIFLTRALSCAGLAVFAKGAALKRWAHQSCTLFVALASIGVGQVAVVVVRAGRIAADDSGPIGEGLFVGGQVLLLVGRGLERGLLKGGHGVDGVQRQTREHTAEGAAKRLYMYSRVLRVGAGVASCSDGLGEQ